MDNRIKAPQELRVHLGLSYLGMVPAFSPKGTNILISDDVPAEFCRIDQVGQNQRAVLVGRRRPEGDLGDQRRSR